MAVLGDSMVIRCHDADEVLMICLCLLLSRTCNQVAATALVDISPIICCFLVSIFAVFGLLMWRQHSWLVLLVFDVVA